ncbi:pentapeptide repeat-containing protein [Nesterenkonia sp. YGD6]|uniref:pentapeptide repeat-containing protein n=1 Tax=Nesterenkonia sp. YGD6 TaxID=2901231 RepID=UPI001F4D1745|nr:pentapeptide repeat-containing protein [Nesterenkonia sp. YGD6]MCH8562630.1 pentapeptide repeat-containing protein [Nesterenkonia sp. YGD6]
MRPIQGPRLRASRLEDLAPGSAAALECTGQGDRIVLEDADLSGIDLSGGRLTECLLRSVTLMDADLSAASVVESHWERVNAPHLKAPRSTWREVVMDGSRFGVAELYDAGISGLVLRGCKLDLVNLRNAVIADVLFENCTIAELDISGARATRVRFSDCTVGTLEAREARLKDVDLRGARLSRIVGLAGLKGAVISEEQLVELAPALAEHLGLLVSEAPR